MVSKKSAPKETYAIDKELFQQTLQSAKRFAEANIVTDANILEKQYQINATAMKELDVMKNDRRELLIGTDKLCKKYDMLKIKYDDLLDKYKYLKGKKNKQNGKENDQS